MAVIAGSGAVYVDGRRIGYTVGEVLRGLAEGATREGGDLRLELELTDISWLDLEFGAWSGIDDEGSGMTVDELIDDIDSVLDSYRSDV